MILELVILSLNSVCTIKTLYMKCMEPIRGTCYTATDIQYTDELEQTCMNPALNDFNLQWLSRTPKPTTSQINIQPFADQCEFQKAGIDFPYWILVSFETG